MNLEAQSPLVYFVDELRDNEGDGDVLGNLWRWSEKNTFFGDLEDKDDCLKVTK